MGTQRWFQQGPPARYEWNDGEMIKFTGMKKKHLMLIRTLQQLFFQTKAAKHGGAIISKQDVMLTGIQMRRPDLAYFSGEQIDNSATSEDELIPAFVIEVISSTDDAIQIEENWPNILNQSCR
ncbi:MAG: Uma2 family endonuclease [Spirosomataceae bacterium]